MHPNMIHAVQSASRSPVAIQTSLDLSGHSVTSEQPSLFAADFAVMLGIRNIDLV
jgi:hypothetical protein